MAETIPPVEHVKSLLDQLGGSSGPIPEGNPSQLGGKLEQRLQDVGSALAKFFTHGGLNVSDYTPVQAPAYKDYLPKNKLGQTPEEYVQNPADKTAPEGPITPTITDKEFETLQNESAKGNHFAMQLLDAYKPKYGPTAIQFEQSLTNPMVQDIKALPGLYNTLQEQQSIYDNQLPAALSQIEQTAKQYSGIAPQSPNAQTSALMNQYASIANNAIAASTPIMDAALKDLGTAAEISVRTFPYTTLIQDLLNRYAYQIESPSYSPPPMTWPGLPESIKKLFAASTGSVFGGGGITAPSTLGTPDQTGLTTPSLQPASNPSSSG